jgi:hypothetical protein
LSAALDLGEKFLVPVEDLMDRGAVVVVDAAPPGIGDLCGADIPRQAGVRLGDGAGEGFGGVGDLRDRIERLLCAQSLGEVMREVRDVGAVAMSVALERW